MAISFSSSMPPLGGSASPDAGRQTTAGMPVLQPSAVARFDALVHELHPDAPRVDVPRLRRLINWLNDMPPEQAEHEIGERLHRLHELRAMCADADWDCAEAQRMRLKKLNDYVQLENDLIPDHVPLLGRLDDVLLIELTWPAFAEEVEDYRDFCDYRTTRRPTGDAAEQRAAWVRDRLDELALASQRLRVHMQHYGPDPHAAEHRPFRVV